MLPQYLVWSESFCNTTHGGEGELQREEWYDKKVAIKITLFGKEEMSGYMEAAGFEVEREPYEFEYPARRV